MYYINATPTENGNYGNPMGQPFVGCVALPDELLSDYIDAKGFIIPGLEQTEEIPVNLVLEGVKEFYIVTSLQTNEEALAAYEAEHPEVEPEEPEATVEERVTALENAIERGLNL